MLTLELIAKLVKKWNGYGEDLDNATAEIKILEDALFYGISELFVNEQIIEPYGCIGILIGWLVEENQIEDLKNLLPEDCKVYAMTEAELNLIEV